MLKIIALIVVICLVWQYSVRKKRVNYFSAHERKTIDGVLSFGDVVGWFKTIKGMDQNVDTPFVVDAQKKGCLKEKLHVVLNMDVTTGKKGLLIGVYNQSTDQITHSCLIEADDFDEKIKETIGDELVVVLN